MSIQPRHLPRGCGVWKRPRRPSSLRENGASLCASLYTVAENAFVAGAKHLVCFDLFCLSEVLVQKELTFRPKRSGVEESAVLPVLSGLVEKRVSPLRLSR